MITQFFSVSKKLVILGLLFTFIPFSFLSCSDPDDETPSNSTVDSCYTPSIDSTPSSELISSDWLFLLYFDGDSNLNDSVWENLHETELALKQLNDRAAKGEAVPSVTCVVLWDGIDKYKDEKSKETYNCITRLNPHGTLLELGASDGRDSETDKSWFISPNTKDFTKAEKDWLPKEPSMNDTAMLTNFLKWAKKHYTAKNIVLSLSDHGSGTDYETTEGGAWNDIPSRSLCSDEDSRITNDNRLLTTTDIKQALSQSGLQPNVIWMDCCLQASCEVAYQLKGVADYLVSSASISVSNDYQAVIGYLEKQHNYKDLPAYIVSSYRYAYYNTENSPRTPAKDEVVSSARGVMTQVGIDLNSEKQQSLYDAFETLADSLLTHDANNLSTIYNNHLYQHPTNQADCKGQVYNGTFVYLTDIGYFCYQLYCDDSVSEESKNAAIKLQEALGSVVNSAWVGRKKQGEPALYRTNVFWTEITNAKPEEIVEFGPDAKDEDNQTWTFGPTVAIKAMGDTEEKGVQLNTKYAEVTGFSAKWGELIKIWNSAN